MRAVGPGEEVDMVTYANHVFVAMDEKKIRLFHFVMNPDNDRFAIINCTAASTAANKYHHLTSAKATIKEKRKKQQKKRKRQPPKVNAPVPESPKSPNY